MTEIMHSSRDPLPPSLLAVKRRVGMLLRARPALRHGLVLALWTLIWLVVIALPILIYAAAIQFVGNIDTVQPGQVYRSATLSSHDLGAVIRAAHIRTVLNLRGESPGQSWYQDEVQVTTAHDVRLINLPMSAIREPSPALLADLVRTLETAERPMLIHCSSGSDRTGLAAALYDLIVLKKPVSVARGELSFYWGHFPYIISPTVAMDDTFAKFASQWVKSHPDQNH